MEDAGLVTRARGTEDRRMVKTHLTEKGLDLVDSLDEAVEQEHLRRLGHLSAEQLGTLIDLLTLVRSTE
jgi:DNA-binding MarR family transcriptional regulator